MGVLSAILIHGLTEIQVRAALDYIMGVALELGLVCQPVKTSPPAQVQKFCGFIYETHGVPTCNVPANKTSRALALLSFVRRELTGPLARLNLSVVTGVLQSLIPATAGNIGSNFLASLYSDLHQGMPPKLRGHKSSYYDHVEVSGSSLEEMDWWFTSLQTGLSRRSQPSDAKIFSLHFGDGNGTGTGGTGVFYDRPEPGDRESWMGTWTAHQATPESSNWKELRTLVEFMWQEPLATSRFCNHKVFHFTDNMVTYDVYRKGTSTWTSPRLRALVRELKGLEPRHGCQLEVIHVPGEAIIDEGSDGLSRGVWNTPIQVPRTFPVAKLFAPFAADPSLIRWAYAQAGIVEPPNLQVFDDTDPWWRSNMIKRHCVWSVRSLRSALGSLHTWTLSLGPAGSAHRSQHQVFGPEGVLPSDDLLTSMTLSGMSRRLGTESRPPTAIRFEHVVWNLAHRTRLIQNPDTPTDLCYDLCLANLAELLFWLGWLRANEYFSLCWCDVEHILPAQAAGRGLPRDTGALLLQLLESTKSHQFTQVDQILAARTASGFRLGLSFTAVVARRPVTARATDPLFQSTTGRTWDSHFFWHTHLYHLLEQQRLEGDAYLRPYDSSTATRTIVLLFYSMGTYRRGGTSFIKRHHTGCVRKATPDEVTNHGQWRSRNRGSEPMPTHYDEPILEDLIYITLFCM
jgi:hypothetical protein